MQKQHPDELFNLLTRVIPYLRSKIWETRIAAAKAVGGIVSNAEKFDPNAEDDPVSNGHGPANASNGSFIKEENIERDLPISEDQLDLKTLDISSILRYGKTLLGSAGKEYDFKLAAMDPAERLAHQKKSLTARLGLGGEYIEEDLMTENDIVAQTPGAQTPGMHRLDTSVPRTDSISSGTGYPVQSPHDSMVSTPIDEKNGAGAGLSKRQLNMLKRKAKKDVQNRANKVQIVDLGPRRSSSQVDHPQTPATSQPHPVKLEPKQENSKESVGDYFSLERKGSDDDSKLEIGRAHV